MKSDVDERWIHVQTHGQYEANGSVVAADLV